MEFGKVKTLDELSRISFNLPAREDRETRFFHPPSNPDTQAPRPSKLPLYIGTPSWNQSSFLGRLYPSQCSPQEYLFYYAQQFNTIELNTTFYRIPDPKVVVQWKNSTPSGFKFCPKIFQKISRFENLHDIPKLTQDYINSIEYFEDRLGPIFLQLPPHFSPHYFPILKRFLGLIPKHISLSIEFRHPHWWAQQQLIPLIYDLLYEHNVSTVITDVAGRRDVIHQSLTHPSGLIRFVGNELHPTDFSRIQSWADRFSEWANHPLGPFYFFIHQPHEIGYIELIEFFIKTVSQNSKIQLQQLNDTLAQPQLSLF